MNPGLSIKNRLIEHQNPRPSGLGVFKIITTTDLIYDKTAEISVIKAKGDDFLKGQLDPGIITARLENQIKKVNNSYF